MSEKLKAALLKLENGSTGPHKTELTPNECALILEHISELELAADDAWYEKSTRD